MPVVERMETRQLLSTVQTFDGGGTSFTLQQVGGPPPAHTMTGGPSGSFMELATTPTNPVVGNNNSMSFVTTDPGTFNQAVADWDFRVTPTSGNGQGMSFAFLNTANFGTAGAASSVQPQSGLYDGSLAFGFDTTNDTVVVSMNSGIIAAQDLSGMLNLASGQFIHAEATVNFAGGTVSLVLTPSGGGSPVTAFDNVQVDGLAPYQSRISMQASNSGTTFANFDIDNIAVNWTGQRLPGTISFGSSSYTVLENQPFALVNVIRSGGTAGSVTVGFAAAGGTAQNGLNYVAVSGPITFAEGETVKTVAIPILNDQLFDGDKTVDLYLSNPTFAAPLAPPITSVLTIINTNPFSLPPLVSPTVRVVHAPRSRRVIGFQLSFNQPMDPVSAQDLGNYQALLPARSPRFAPRVDPLSRAVLDPSGLTVTLFRASPARSHLTRFLQIVVSGQPFLGLTNVSGTFLAGNNTQAGTNAVLNVYNR
jgi:hypothetical protein